MYGSRRSLAGFFGINVILSLLANLVFGNFGSGTPWRHLFAATAITTLFSVCCSSLCFVGLPLLVPYARRRLGFPLYWGAIVLILIGFASAGSLLALVVLAVVGYIPTVEAFIRWFVGSLKVSIIVTLLFGVFGTIIEMLRSRLDATTLALRTKERDEADARRIAVEAQLASLESRVQPHFLFNTLNSIAALIHEDPAGAERMTGQLASLLRSSLDQLTPLIPLEEELRTVRNYLEIERVRFGERLRYDITADREVASVRVPRLAVQTLVENSVKYAVSPRREGASIAVRAAATNGHVRIEVEDDGPGFEAAATPAGHGLALVRERLAMTFGAAASMMVDSRAGRTLITIEAADPDRPHASDPEGRT